LHAELFKQNERFELVALCDIDEERLKTASELVGGVRTYTDAATMLGEQRPDVFCFCTLPALRMPLVRLGVENGVKLIAMEKPLATSLAEAKAMVDLCQQAGVKMVVSHQQKYGQHWRKAKEIIDSGALGRVHTIYGTTTGWMLQMATHITDYILYFNDYAKAEWVLGQAHGREKLSDNHPSPGHLGGFIQFSNGVRGVLEAGSLAPDVPEVEYFWHKARVSAYGTEGFAEAVIGLGWRACTRASGGAISGPGGWSASDQVPYIQDIAEWLDDPAKVHPCNGERAYQGLEIIMAMVRSAVEHRKVDLPLEPGEPEIEMLNRVLPG